MLDDTSLVQGWSIRKTNEDVDFTKITKWNVTSLIGLERVVNSDVITQ